MKYKNQKYLKRFGSLEGKTAVITGASGAIGKQIAINFLLMGSNVILPSLPNETEQLKTELSAQFDANKIQVYPIDLTDYTSINKFIEQIKTQNIDYLINNAGVIGRLAYKINFLGTMYLTLRLTPLLNKNKNSSVVFQNSFSYRMAKIDWEDLENTKDPKKIRAYAKTKRMQALAVVYLKKNFLKDYPNVKFVIAHPGAVASDINGKATDFQKKISKLFLHSAQTASLSATKAALANVPDNKLAGPRYLGIWGRPRFRGLQKSLYSGQEQAKIKPVIDALIKDTKNK